MQKLINVASFGWNYRYHKQSDQGIKIHAELVASSHSCKANHVEFMTGILLSSTRFIYLYQVTIQLKPHTPGQNLCGDHPEIDVG